MDPKTDASTGASGKVSMSLFYRNIGKSGNTEDFFANRSKCGQSMIRRDCRGNETEDVKRKQHLEGGRSGELLSGE